MPIRSLVIRADAMMLQSNCMRRTC